MSEREDRAAALFASGLNCAQSVFCAYADEFGLDGLTARKVSCALGGGVGRLREICGAVSGAAMVLGMRHGPDKRDVYPRVQAFAARFREECGAVVCRELLAGTGATALGVPEARTPEYYARRPCGELVRTAVRLLEELAAEESAGGGLGERRADVV